MAATIRLGLDLTACARGATGLATYARGLLSARSALGVSELVGFVNRPGLGSPRLADVPAADLEGVRIVHARVPRSVLNRSWLGRGVGGIEDLVGEIDVFHAADLLAPRARSAAVVLTVHDLAWCRDPGDRGGRRSGGRAPRRRDGAVRALERWFAPSLGQADAVIVPSEATADELARRFDVGGERVSVVPHGVGASFAATPAPDDDERRAAAGVPADALLVVGPFDERKDAATAVEAYGQLRERTPDPPPLVLVGPDAGGGEALDAALARAKPEPGASGAAAGAVVRVGRVDPRTLAALYRSARAVLYLSREEGFGLPLLEAMACGVPVVTSRIPALDELGGDVAHRVHPGDPRALARLLERVLGDPDGAAERAAAGVARAAGYTWERCAAATAEVYRRARERRVAR